MLAVAVSEETIKEIELNSNEKMIGQSLDKIVLQVESVPSYEHEDITNSDIRFLQRGFDGKYGEAVTYRQYLEINSLLEEVGEAESFEGLLKKKIDLQDQELSDTQVALVDIYEAFS